MIAFLLALLVRCFTVIPFPGFDDDPHPPIRRRSSSDRPPDDGGWSLERPAWEDYPPHFKGWRDGQLAAVDEILAAYQSGARTVLLDGQTGVGKTFIANGVRAELKKVCTYSCHSLALQEQWRKDFAPYPVLMGRSNYPITWPGVPRWVTAADCTFNAANPEAGCAWCPDKASCPYERAKNRALAAKYRCVNHAYLIVESAHVGRFTHGLLILDEAEMTEGAILNQVSVTFPLRIRNDLDLGKPKYVTKEDSIKEWLSDVVVPALSRDVSQYPRDTTDRKVVRARDAAKNRLDQTVFVLAHFDDGWVFDRSSDTWALRPVWASHWGAKWIGKKAERILAMSATLVSGTQTALDLGLPEPHVTVRVEGGFDPALRPTYLAPLADLRSKGEDGGPKSIPPAEVTKLVIGLRAIMARHPRDRILVHTHTYKLTRDLYAQLANPRAMMYEPGGRDEALQAYLASPGAVLLAPSLERGVNLPDDDCRVVVWAKVPFPSLGDPVVSRRRYSGGPAGARWYAVETLRAIVQGCGRAVRHADDWAEIYILDAAFMSLLRRERYLFPNWFLAALRTDFNTRALMAEGERITRIQTLARNARARLGQPDPPLRPPFTGSRHRAPS